MRALLFLFPIACSPQVAAPQSPVQPPPSKSEPSAFTSTPPVTPQTPPAPTTLERAESTQPPAIEPAPNEPPAAFPAFEIEPPYLPGKYPRPPGKMAASLADEQLARWNLGGSSHSAHPSNRPNYHPAPRVVVDLKTLGRAVPERATKSRYATAATLVAEARNQGYWPFRVCFEQGLRDSPELSGQVAMRVRVGTSGRVASARLRGAPLRSHQTVECVLRAASSLTFKKPPARRVDVDLLVKFWPGDAPLPARDERTNARWNESAATQAVTSGSSEIARCCAEALGRDPRLWGRLAFTIQADSGGRVLEARESESHFPDRDASECMRQALTRLSTSPTGAPQFVVAVRCGQPSTPPPAVPEAGSDDRESGASGAGEAGSTPVHPPE